MRADDERYAPCSSSRPRDHMNRMYASPDEEDEPLDTATDEDDDFDEDEDDEDEESEEESDDESEEEA